MEFGMMQCVACEEDELGNAIQMHWTNVLSGAHWFESLSRFSWILCFCFQFQPRTQDKEKPELNSPSEVKKYQATYTSNQYNPSPIEKETSIPLCQGFWPSRVAANKAIFRIVRVFVFVQHGESGYASSPGLASSRVMPSHHRTNVRTNCAYNPSPLNTRRIYIWQWHIATLRKEYFSDAVREIIFLCYFEPCFCFNWSSSVILQRFTSTVLDQKCKRFGFELYDFDDRKTTSTLYIYNATA